MTDLTPTYPLLSAEEEIVLPDLFQDTPQQMVGGFQADNDQISQGKVTIQGTAQKILLGDATAPTTGTGIFMGNDGAASIGYDFRVGNPAGSYMHWDASASTLTVVGTITATAGTIGGFTIGTDYIKDAADSFGLASTVSGSDDVRFWAGDTFANRATADFRVTEAGAVTASSMTITGGAITGTPIASIPNNTSTDISLLDQTHDLVFSVTDKDTVAWASGTITLSNGRTFSITGSNTGNMAARTYIYLDTGVSSTALQTTTTVSTAMGANKKLIAVAQNGSAQATFTVYDGIGGIKLGASNTSISNNNWTYSGTWSVTDADTVAWGAGTLTTSDGGSYSISGSNTGNMAAKTYIYFDLGTSSTAFQTTTTAATAIGDGKILIAIAQNGTAEANYMVMNDKQHNIDAANIVAGSITANEIAASTITAGKLSVSQLSAIAADMGTLTTGIINLSSGTSYIKSGQSAYDSGTGFWLEYNSGTPRFSIGNSAGSKLTWDGTSLSVVGVSNVTKYFTAGENLTAGDAVFIATGTESDNIYNADNFGSAYTLDDTNDRQAQTFTTRAETGAVKVVSAKIGLASTGGSGATVTVAIHATAASKPTGAALQSQTIAQADIGVSAGLEEVTFSSPATLTGGTLYALVVSISGGSSPVITISSSNDAYSGGARCSSTDGGTNYTTEANDLAFRVVQTFATAGRVYKTTTSQGTTVGTDMYISFIGIVTTTTSRASSAPVTIAGEATGLSGLTTGSIYYISDTLGALATSAGTATRKAGIALSSTSLLITNVW